MYWVYFRYLPSNSSHPLHRTSFFVRASTSLPSCIFSLLLRIRPFPTFLYIKNSSTYAVQSSSLAVLHPLVLNLCPIHHSSLPSHCITFDFPFETLSTASHLFTPSICCRPSAPANTYTKRPKHTSKF